MKNALKTLLAENKPRTLRGLSVCVNPCREVKTNIISRENQKRFPGVHYCLSKRYSNLPVCEKFRLKSCLEIATKFYYLMRIFFIFFLQHENLRVLMGMKYLTQAIDPKKMRTFYSHCVIFYLIWREFESNNLINYKRFCSHLIIT